jgi:serine/threonine protein kinase/WD40 repeat protein
MRVLGENRRIDMKTATHMPETPREKDLFVHALELPAGEREAFLSRQCRDPAAWRRISALLKAHESAGAFLEEPPENMAVGRGSLTIGHGAGDKVGPYKLLDKIGEGGWGMVFRAEQEMPVRRTVALKLLKPGMDTRAVIARFEAERQALAMMDHPNIARVFDAGATSAGHPYFVMELVEGTRITTFCDEQYLGAEERLGLFTQVCHAVQHAHQKGVIHRDLKPSNILVSKVDGKPVCKVIDFGVAKAVQGRLTDSTLVTAVEQFIGTPAYMSPEQADTANPGVDTRSDIYSLGVLLYELLVGRPPFDPKLLVQAGLDEMRRVIKEVEPQKPSTLLGTLGDADRAMIARMRGTDVVKLAHFVRGDLDWIALRCLEKSPARRYDTAGELARDIERHLQDEPVQARPPGRLYRLWKFARRHKTGAASVVTAAVILLLFAMGSGVAALRARQAQRIEAQRLSRTDLALGSQLLEQGRISEGLAFLVRAARSDPENNAIGPRLISALGYNSFPVPAGSSVKLPYEAAWEIRYLQDGKRLLAVAKTPGKVHLLEWESGKVIQTIDAGGHLNAWSLDRDERRIAVGGIDGVVRIFDLASGRVLAGPMRHDRMVFRVVFSPDGRWLASGSSDMMGKLWDAATGELKAAAKHDYTLPALNFSPSGDRLLTQSHHGDWCVFSVPDLKPLVPVQRPVWNSANTSSDFSPDGRYVVVIDGVTGMRFHDAVSGVALGEPIKHAQVIYFAVFSPDGRMLATCSLDQTVRLWEVPTGRLLMPPLEQGDEVVRAHFTPDGGRLVVMGREGVTKVWDLSTRALAMEPVRVPLGDLSPDGKEFATVIGPEVRRWRTASSSIQPQRFKTEPGSTGIWWNREKTRAWVAYPERMQEIDGASGKWLGAPRVFPEAAAVAKDGLRYWWPVLSPDATTLFFTSKRGGRELWDLRSPEMVRHPLPSSAAKHATFSPDSSLFAIVHLPEASVVTVSDARTAKEICPPLRHPSGVHALAFSPDNRFLIAGTGENQSILWDLATGRPVSAPLLDQAFLISVAASPDNRFVATGSRTGLAQVWDAHTGSPVGLPLQHEHTVNGVHFTGDSRRLMTRTLWAVRFWEVGTGRPLTESMSTPRAAKHTMAGAVLSEDERFVATWTTGGEIRIWDAASGRLVLEPIQTKEAISTVDFIAAGRNLRVTKNDGGWSVWPLPDLLAEARVPGWLLRLATAVAGGEIDAGAVFQERMATAGDFDEVRHELDQLPADAPFVGWGRWLLAEQGSRVAGPGLSVFSGEETKHAQK